MLGAICLILETFEIVPAYLTVPYCSNYIIFQPKPFHLYKVLSLVGKNDHLVCVVFIAGVIKKTHQTFKVPLFTIVGIIYEY